MPAVAYAAGAAVGPWTLVAPCPDSSDETWIAERNRGAVRTRLVMLPAHAATDPRAFGTFAADLAAAPHLVHPAILRMIEAAPAGGPPWMAFEWCDAIDVRQLGPLLAALPDRAGAIAAVGHIVERMLAALVHAHGCAHVPGGIVHRQLSPTRILVTNEGDVKVTGFGAADRPRDETSGIQSPDLLRYVAPEQIGNDTRAAKADVFATGAILHELLDGRRFRDEHDDAPSLYRLAIAGTTTPLRTPVDPSIEAIRAALLGGAATRPTAAIAHGMFARWPDLARGQQVLARVVRDAIAPPVATSERDSMIAASIAAGIDASVAPPAFASAPAIQAPQMQAPQMQPPQMQPPQMQPPQMQQPQMQQPQMQPPRMQQPQMQPPQMQQPQMQQPQMQQPQMQQPQMQPPQMQPPQMQPPYMQQPQMQPPQMQQPQVQPPQMQQPHMQPHMQPPPMLGPPMVPPGEEGTVELDQAVLAAMRAGRPIPARPGPSPAAPPASMLPPSAPPRELVMPPPAASSSSRSAPPASRAAAPPVVHTPSSVPPSRSAPPQVVARSDHGPLDFQPTYEPTSTTTLRARKSARNLVAILVVAGVVSIAVGVGVGYMLVDDEPTAPPAKAAPSERPSKAAPQAPPESPGPKLDPHTK